MRAEKARLGGQGVKREGQERGGEEKRKAWRGAVREVRKGSDTEMAEPQSRGCAGPTVQGQDDQTGREHSSGGKGQTRETTDPGTPVHL